MRNAWAATTQAPRLECSAGGAAAAREASREARQPSVGQNVWRSVRQSRSARATSAVPSRSVTPPLQKKMNHQKNKPGPAR